jgi:hypothetical protein
MHFAGAGISPLLDRIAVTVDERLRECHFSPSVAATMPIKRRRTGRGVSNIPAKRSSKTNGPARATDEGLSPRS